MHASNKITVLCILLCVLWKKKLKLNLVSTTFKLSEQKRCSSHIYIFYLICSDSKDTVNPTKCGCPFALKMAACQLLLEITTFLRETFPCLPRPRTEPLVVSSEIKIQKRKSDVNINENLISTCFVCRIWTAAACVWTQSSAAIATRGRSALRASWTTKTGTIPSTAAATLWSLTPPAMIRRPRRLRVRLGVIQIANAADYRSVFTCCSLLIVDNLSPLPCSPAPVRKIRIGGSRLLQIKGARSFRVKKVGSLSSIRRAGSLKSTKLSRQDSESENEEGLLSQTQSRDTVTDIGMM